jgi:hypothetical protein
VASFDECSVLKPYAETQKHVTSSKAIKIVCLYSSGEFQHLFFLSFLPLFAWHTLARLHNVELVRV